MARERFRLLLVVALLVLPAAAALARSPQGQVAVNPLQPFETKARHALLIDAETETILFEKAPDAPFPPASLAKLMTMAVVFEALKANRLKLDDAFTVSENAWRKGGAPAGGTTMFAKLNSSVKVRDLIRGAIVQTANDACLVLAEGISGSEAQFVELMNAEAGRLGLAGSRFANATGLPDPNQVVTARDLARLAHHLIQSYPESYATYREPAFSWNGINQNNRNPLITANIGADGLAAGGTEATGFGLVGSAVRDGQRLIVVIGGAATDRDRLDEARKLLDWGFRSFEKVRLFTAGEVVAEATVFGGDRAAVGLVSSGFDAFLPRGGRELVRARAVYQGPVNAPVAKGQRIGSLELSVGDQVVREVPLFAAADVGIGSLSQRAFDGFREIAFGWLPWR